MSLNPWIAKGNEGYNPYIGVYAPLSFESKTNPEIRQPYVNGHYCYAAKAVIVINGLGVVGHISMFNQRFCQMHPEAIAKQTDDPDTDKEIGGSVALRHVLSDFFTASLQHLKNIIFRSLLPILLAIPTANILCSKTSLAFPELLFS